KVVLEVPAPSDGVITEIRVSDGATVTSGQVLAVLEPGAAGARSDGGGDAAAARPAEKTAAEPAAQPRAEEAVREAPQPRAAAERAAERETAAATVDRQRPEPRDALQRMGPAVRKLVEEHDIDPAAIRGSGREGRVTKADVLDYLASAQPVTTELDDEARPDERPVIGGRREQRVAMTRLRRRIAERLVEAQRTAAMLTTFNEVDMSAVMALRKRYQEEFQKRHEIKLGFMSFFVRASIEALRRFPLVNASIDGTDIVYHEYFDIG